MNSRYKILSHTIVAALALTSWVNGQSPRVASPAIGAHLFEETPAMKAGIALHCLERAFNHPSKINRAILRQICPTGLVDSLMRQLDRCCALLGTVPNGSVSAAIRLQLDSVRESADFTTAYASLEVTGSGGCLRQSVPVRLMQSGSSTISNPDEVGTQLEQLAKRSGLRSSPTQKASARRPSSLSQTSAAQVTSSNMLVPTSLNSQVSVLSVSTSDDLLQGPIFSRPTGALAASFSTDPGLHSKVLLVSDPNWNRIVYGGSFDNDNAGVHEDLLQTTGQYGSDGYSFKQPQGLAFCYPYWFAVADGYNDRALIYAYNDLGPSPTFQLQWQLNSYNGSPLGFVADVAAGRLQRDASYWAFELAAVDRDSNRVCIYSVEKSSSGLRERNVFPSSAYTNQVVLHRPTAACYARNPLTHQQWSELYIADAGNRRLVAVNTDPASTGVDGYSTFVFPSDAYLSSVDVDDYGGLWVVDSYHSVIYSFADGIEDTQPVIFTAQGSANGPLSYPQRLKAAEAWNYCYGSGSGTCSNPAVSGDFVATEYFGQSTGVRRFLWGGDITGDRLYYNPANSGFQDFIGCDWYQTGPDSNCVVTLKYGGRSKSQHVFPLVLAGSNSIVFPLDSLASDGVYTVSISGTSIFSPGLHLQLTDSFNVHRYVQNGPHFYPKITDFADYSDPMPLDCRRYPRHWWSAYINVKDNWFDSSISYYWQPASCVDIYADSNLASWIPSFKVVKNDTVYFRIDSLRLPPMTQGMYYQYLKVFFTTDPYHDNLNYWQCHWSDSSAYIGELYSSWCQTPCVHCDQPWPPGCPFLYDWDGQNYVLENNILPQSELDTSAVTNTDLFRVFPPVVVDGRICRFRLAEDEQEVSSLSQLNLLAVDVPQNAKPPLVGNRADLLDPSGSPTLPSSAVTDQGQNVLSQILIPDSNVFTAQGPGYLDLEYHFLSDTMRQRGGAAQSLAPPPQNPPGGLADPPPAQNESRQTERKCLRQPGHHQCLRDSGAQCRRPTSHNRVLASAYERRG